MTRDPLNYRKNSDEILADRIDRSVKKLLAMNHMTIRRLDSNPFNNKRRNFEAVSPSYRNILKDPSPSFKLKKSDQTAN